jgi:hypothetical protein
MALASLMANAVASIHIGYFLFIAGGVIAIVVGGPRGWTWVSNPWFRIAHVAAVYIVLFEEVTGLPCPLNQLEWTTRAAATGAHQATSGVGGVLDFLLFATIPPLALEVLYWSLGVILPILMWVYPPRRRRGGPVRVARSGAI